MRNFTIIMAALAAMFLLAGRVDAATNYTFTPTSNYAVVTDYTSCAAGVDCRNFTTGMNVSGYFSLNAKLAPNLVSSDITSQIVAFDFTNGVDHITSANGGLIQMLVSTDGASNITSAGLLIEQWQNSPNYFNFIQILQDGRTYGAHADYCDSIDPGTKMCVTEASPHPTSYSDAGPAGGNWSYSVVADPVPTLNDVGLIIVALGLLFSVWRLRSGTNSA